MTTQKITLTTDLLFESVIIAFIPFILLAFVISLPFNFIVITSLIAVFAICGHFTYTLLTPNKINFDNSTIYVHSRQDIKCIKLEQVTKIKMTMTCFNRKNIWMLYYTDHHNKRVTVSFVPKILLTELFQLQDLVKQKNPEAIIQNYTTTFDVE